MGIGLGGVASYTSAWQFVDLMKYAREWRCPKGLEIVEDEYGWPVAMKDPGGARVAIGEGRAAMMWLYNRNLTGGFILTWQGDGEVAVRRRGAETVSDDYPRKNRRVYRWGDRREGVFDLVVSRSNPKDHVRDIRLVMADFENAASPFHPLFKERLKPFPCFRFMDWGRTNNSEQVEWCDRTTPRHMRQTRGVAWEYMIALSNETDKDMWICIPHRASDDYVRRLAGLLRERLEPGRRIYVEYSNEIWNGAFKQTRWLWDKAREMGRKERPWEFAAELCGRRSAQIWKIMEGELGNSDRLVRVIAHFRFLDKVMKAARDPAHGTGRVDLIALNGYFISQDALKYTLRTLDRFDVDRVFADIEQLHLMGKATGWKREIASAREKYGLPITTYEGGQHFANPFSGNLQGQSLVERMFEINGHPRIRGVYRTALETWRLAGGDGFTAFVDCGNWSKYGCWGHLRRQDQPLEDVVNPATGKVTERAAYKYLALLDYIERRKRTDAEGAPSIATAGLPQPEAGKPYSARLEAQDGRPPYRWSLLGGRLPDGLTVEPGGRIAGTAKKPEQTVFILDCTDSAGRCGSRIFGLFMEPTAPGGLREVTSEVAGGAPLAESARTGGYTVEVDLSLKRSNRHARGGLAFNLTPQGDPEDYLRIAVGENGGTVEAYSRYVRGGSGELWGKRVCRLIPDEGEDASSPALDPGEVWRLRATVRPASSPGAIDLAIGVYDEKGRPRVGSDRNDTACGIWLIRELALKKPLLSGPFGLMKTGNFTYGRAAWAAPSR
jgi:hypothetical protein